MLFSAIALVAFTATSMAGEISVEKKINETAKENTISVTKKSVDFKENACVTIKRLAYNLAVSEGAGDCTAEAYSDLVYSNCMG